LRKSVERRAMEKWLRVKAVVKPGVEGGEIDVERFLCRACACGYRCCGEKWALWFAIDVMNQKTYVL
jgi:hypothetical protein